MHWMGLRKPPGDDVTCLRPEGLLLIMWIENGPLVSQRGIPPLTPLLAGHCLDLPVVDCPLHLQVHLWLHDDVVFGKVMPWASADHWRQADAAERQQAGEQLAQPDGHGGGRVGPETGPNRDFILQLAPTESHAQRRPSQLRPTPPHRPHLRQTV